MLVLALRISDWLVLMLTGWLAAWLHFGTSQPSTEYMTAFVVASLVSFSIYPLFSIYRAWRGASKMEEARALFVAWSVLFAILAVLAVLTKTAEQYSRLWFGYWYVLGGASLFLIRFIIRAFLGYIRAHGLNHRSIVIVGASDLGQRVATNIKLSPWYGYDILGFFSNIDTPSLNTYLQDIPILGTTDDLSEYVAENNVDQVWIAMGMERAETIKKVLSDIEVTAVDVRYVPDIFSFSLLNHSVTEVAGMPVLNLSVSPMEGSSRIIKAIEDRVFAALILILISPILAFLAIGVKLTSTGPVFYRQERVSWNGSRFKMLKFRSMPVDIEKDGVRWGGAKDKALHPFGQFIRKTSLDELPQFLNVLLGDMSIVGPRPERTVFVDQFKHEIPGYMQKHKVKAGITGWAQINGWRGDTDLKKRIEHDLYYIENWSVWFDLKIIFLTIFKGLINKNAY